jgi:hypothetical protein
MSFAAHVWASGVAPVANVYEYAVLNRMADEVDESGEGCMLGTPTIARDIVSDTRSVRRALDSLEERGLIAKGDQARAAYIRADRRPIVYDLLIPAMCFADIKRTNERRAAQGRAPLTPENRPVQGPPPDDAKRKRRDDVGKPRDKKIGDSQEEQDRLDAGTQEGSDPDGLSSSHPATGGLPDSPSDTGCLVVHDDLSTSPPRGDYQTADPVPDPGNDPRTPPSLSEVNSLGAAPSASPDGGGNLTEQERALLTAALDEALATRASDSAWSRQAVIEAMQREMSGGARADRVAAGIKAAAADPQTNYPGRIGYLLRQASAAAVAPAETPTWAQGPVKYLDPCTPMCRKHRGEPEIGCGKCKADALAVEEPEPAVRPEEAAGITGRELARQMAATGRAPDPRQAPKKAAHAAAVSPEPAAALVDA